MRAKTINEWGLDQWDAMYKLIMSESGFNNNAQNSRSTAYGLFQFLDSTWSHYGCVKTNDVDIQIDCGVKYIKARYGSPSQAMQYHLAMGFY